MPLTYFLVLTQKKQKKKNKNKNKKNNTKKKEKKNKEKKKKTKEKKGGIKVFGMLAMRSWWSIGFRVCLISQ